MGGTVWGVEEGNKRIANEVKGVKCQGTRIQDQYNLAFLRYC